MRRLITAIIALTALAVPAIARASSDVPAWCDASKTQCLNAESDFAAQLGVRFGRAWTDSHTWADDPACPAISLGYGEADCMAYFAWRGEWYFIQGSVSRAQDSVDSATIQYVTTWHRRWRKCSLKGYRLIDPGTLESNAPCNALPNEASYAVGQEMSFAGRIHYVREVGWIFADSGLFAAAGMERVAIYRCGFAHKTITCTNGVGDSLRYIY